MRRNPDGVPIYAGLVYLSRTRFRGLSPKCDDAQDVVEALKAGDGRAAAYCAALLAHHPLLAGFRGAIVPAPRSRPDRPSLVPFAQALVKAGVGRRVVDAVYRAVPVESSRVRRQQGLKGVPAAEHAATIGYRGGLRPGESVLVLDDIVTTGSTITAVANVLRRAGHFGPIAGAAAGYAAGESEALRCPVHYLTLPA